MSPDISCISWTLHNIQHHFHHDSHYVYVSYQLWTFLFFLQTIWCSSMVKANKTTMDIIGKTSVVRKWRSEQTLEKSNKTNKSWLWRNIISLLLQSNKMLTTFDGNLCHCSGKPVLEAFLDQLVIFICSMSNMNTYRNIRVERG